MGGPMISGIRRALTATFAIAVIELVAALAVTTGTTNALAAKTGAGLDPARIVTALVELHTTSAFRALGPILGVVAAVVGSIVVLEPVLSVLWVRAHFAPNERGSMRLVSRVLSTIVVRCVAILATGVVAALLAGLGIAAYLALDGRADPRVRDASLALIALVVATIAYLAYVATDLATFRVALLDESPLESLLGGMKHLDRRILLARTLVIAAGIALSQATLLLPTDITSTATAVFASVALSTLARSALIAFAAPRAIDDATGARFQTTAT